MTANDCSIDRDEGEGVFIADEEKIKKQLF